MLVSPPCAQWVRWWTSHQDEGRSQLGKTHLRSRAQTAARRDGVTSRLVRPTSRGWDSGVRITRVRLASQERRLISSAVRKVP